MCSANNDLQKPNLGFKIKIRTETSNYAKNYKRKTLSKSDNILKIIRLFKWKWTDERKELLNDSTLESKKIAHPPHFHFKLEYFLN